MPTFREVTVAAYCPRKLYYRRRASDADLAPPPAVERVRELAFRYPAIFDGAGGLGDAPIEVTPAQYRANLGAAKAGIPAFSDLCDPPERDVLVEGEDCRGRIHKRLSGPGLSLVFAGNPPDEGVWHPQSVRLVAAATALSSAEGAAVDRVYAEYPAHDVIRPVDVGRRRRGAYRAALRTARAVDGPPARTDSKAKCDPCEYSDRCGVPTRSLRSRL